MLGSSLAVGAACCARHHLAFTLAEGTLYHQRVCALCGPALFCAFVIPDQSSCCLPPVIVMQPRAWRVVLSGGCGPCNNERCALKTMHPSLPSSLLPSHIRMIPCSRASYAVLCAGSSAVANTAKCRLCSATATSGTTAATAVVVAAAAAAAHSALLPPSFSFISTAALAPPADGSRCRRPAAARLLPVPTASTVFASALDAVPPWSLPHTADV